MTFLTTVYRTQNIRLFIHRAENKKYIGLGKKTEDLKTCIDLKKKLQIWAYNINGERNQKLNPRLLFLCKVLILASITFLNQ